ncbi:MAG: alpha/beta hydrolase [Anaerolineae bacterium]|nr:alpha/beta hydrolase [Anaerolineae bacterium]
MSQVTEINGINVAELLDFREMVKQDPPKDAMNHKHFLAQMIYLALVMLLLGACGAPQPTPTVAPTMTPSVEVTSDVVYATPLQTVGAAQRLDVYTPKEAGTWPVIVFLHGWNATKEGHIKESQAIAEQGAVVFTVNWPTWIGDFAARENGMRFREMYEVLSCAIRFARATASDYGGDPSQVTLVGFSYGAETGAWVALAGDDLDRLWEEFASIRGGPPPQVECVVSGGSANVDAFVGIAGEYHRVEPLQERDPELWQIASPYAHLGQNLDLRVRLIHGERDSTTRSEHSVQFNDVLAEAGYDTSLTLFDGTHRVPIELTAAKVMEVAGE